MAVPWAYLKLRTPNPVVGLMPYDELEIPDTYELKEGTHLVGRVSHNSKPTLELPFSVISGQHCVIALNKENGTCVLTDKSSNGTHVNGVHVGKSQARVLNDGDVVTVFEKKDATKPDGPKIEYVFHRAKNHPLLPSVPVHVVVGFYLNFYQLQNSRAPSNRGRFGSFLDECLPLLEISELH